MTSQARFLGSMLISTVVAGLTFTASAARQDTRVVKPGESSQPVSTTSGEAAMAAQNRINRYFHGDVVPKMTGCWSRISGAGTLHARVEYQRSGGVWMPVFAVARGSTLPRGQDAVALGCLQDAVLDTSFAVEEADGDVQQMSVNWSFPVPWSDDLTAAALKMVDTGREPSPGECGGSEGPPAACFECGWIPLLSLALCAPSCTGYVDCTVTSRHSCAHTGTRCITGAVFGNIGGMVAYGSSSSARPR
jgi:hypothetical protein